MGDGNRDGAIKLLVGNGKWYSSDRPGSRRDRGEKTEALMKKVKDMINLMFDRMESIGQERFEKWL